MDLHVHLEMERARRQANDSAQRVMRILPRLHSIEELVQAYMELEHHMTRRVFSLPIRCAHVDEVARRLDEKALQIVTRQIQEIEEQAKLGHIKDARHNLGALISQQWRQLPRRFPRAARLSEQESVRIRSAYPLPTRKWLEAQEKKLLREHRITQGASIHELANAQSEAVPDDTREPAPPATGRARPRG